LVGNGITAMDPTAVVPKVAPEGGPWFWYGAGGKLLRVELLDGRTLVGDEMNSYVADIASRTERGQD